MCVPVGLTGLNQVERSPWRGAHDDVANRGDSPSMCARLGLGIDKETTPPVSNNSTGAHDPVCQELAKVITKRNETRSAENHIASRRVPAAKRLGLE